MFYFSLSNDKTWTTTTNLKAIWSFKNITFYSVYKEISENTCILYISNKFKDLTEIDLDESNITHRPAKLYYTFENIKCDATLRFTDELNKFAYNNYFEMSPFW